MAVIPVDVGGSIAKGLQINMLRQQMEAEKQAVQERNALKTLYSQQFGGTDPQSGIAWNTGRQGPGAMTNEQFTGRAMAINPEVGINWQKHFAGQDAAKLDRQKAEAPLFAAALEGVQDQAGYDKARQFLTQRGLDVTDMPPQYDPATVNMVVQGSKYLANISTPKGEQPTSAMREYELALGQGFKGSFLDYKKQLAEASRAQTNITNNVGPTGVDYGDPPKDYAWARDNSGKIVLSQPDANGYRSPVAVPIAGGPAAQEMAASKQAEEQKKGQKTAQAAIVVQTIDDILKTDAASWWPTAGGLGALSANVPGTPAADIARNLETVRANIGFQQLQQMREASKTGGALGQVSEMENRLLQSVQGSLDQSQSPEQFKRNLERLRRYTLATINGVQIDGKTVSLGDAAEQALATGKSLDDILSQGKILTGAENQYTKDNPAKITGDDEYNNLPNGAYFMGPDNVLRQKP